MSEDSTVPAALEDDRVIQGVRLVPQTLAQNVRAALKLGGALMELAPAALFDLGTRTVETTSIRFFLWLCASLNERQVLKATEERRHDGSRALVLLPEGQVGPGGLPSLGWRFWRPPFEGIWPQALRQLGLADDDPWKDAQPGRLLLLHEGKKLVRYLGVDISLDGAQEFQFLLLLAKQPAGGGYTIDKLVQLLVKAGASRQSVYMIRKRTIAAIKASLKAASPKQLDALICARRKAGTSGYDLTAPFQVL